MEFFKFNPSGEQTLLEQGELINDLTSSMWVERYFTPGEFSFETQLSSGLMEFLPLGTLISHVDTLEVMIVENHEITETVNEDANVTITGRSFVSFLENRIVGVNAARTNPTIVPYILDAANSWNQIVTMINQHIVTPTNTGDSIANITARHTIAGTSGESVERTIDRGTLWERVSELLKVDNLGIKTVRKNSFSGVSAANTDIVIYRGDDQSATVIFSWKSGDLDSANYLFSQKDEKNSAMVVGQYVYTVVDAGPDKYDRRMMLVSATDIDGNLGQTPAGGAPITDVINALAVRGYQALLAQNSITISQADVSKTSQYQYRRDYNVGDLVTLDGNFNQTAVMRVIEYAEIEDENGESGHPTLALPGG